MYTAEQREQMLHLAVEAIDGALRTGGRAIPDYPDFLDAPGTLSRFLSEAEGGLKGVVKAERRLRREEQGKAIEEEKGIRAALAKKLRALEALTLEALAGEGPEFALVMVRRDRDGNLVVLGELPEDVPQLERAAKRLVG